MDTQRGQTAVAERSARGPARSWWALVAAGSLEAAAAFAAAAAAVRPPAWRAGGALLRAGPAVRPRRGGPALAAGREPADAGDWGATSERDQAMGFLAAEAVPAGSERASDAATRAARAELLAQQAREALEAANEAEELARRVKAKMGVSAAAQAPKKPAGNGLSGMLSPVALKMAADQGEYLRRCPVRQMQEDLAEIRCGVMNIVGALGPANLLTLGALLYVISVVQLSL